jgi:hypothetical protein
MSMLIKYGDRLTIDGFLALRAATKGNQEPLREFLSFVHEVRVTQPPSLRLPKAISEAIRFFVSSPNRSGQRSLIEILTERETLKREEQRLVSPLFFVRRTPERYDEFLLSRAHEELAFSNQPLVAGYTAGHLPSLLTVNEGRVGRKYACSQMEVVSLLGKNTKIESMLNDVEMQTGNQFNLKSIDELDAFIRDEPETRLDLVLDILQLTANAYFDLENPQDAEIRERLFTLNAAAYATLDFWFFPPGEASFKILPSDEAGPQLRHTLVSLLGFAKRKNLSSEAQAFAEALQLLDGEDITLPSRLWQLCELPAETFNLYRASLAADNFAGMGSWNDVQIDKDEIYRKLSNELCLNIVEGICASAP